MADVNIGELVTVSLRKRARGLADNVTDHIPLLRRLKKKGLVNTYDGAGGRVITIPLEYGEASFQRYRGFDPLTVQETEVFDAAEYDPVQAAVAIAISGRQMKMNMGKSAAIRFVTSKQRNAEKTMMNRIAEDAMSDGTQPNQINGLQALISKTPATGTVGGINRANFSFWRNKVRDVTDEFTTFDATGVRRTWNLLWLDCTRGMDQPDLVVTDAVTYEHYWSGLQAQQRYASEKEAAAGFQSLKFASADVMFDGTVPPKTAYMLNTDYLEFLAYPGANFEPSDRREPYNQDAFVQHILFMGNLTLSNASLQGVMKE